MGSLLFPEAYALSQDPVRIVKELQRSNVLKKEMICSCGRSMNINNFESNNDKICWRCPQKSCKKRKSVREDSYFAGHRLTIGQIFMIIFCVLKYPKMLSKYIAEIVGTSENTLVNWGCFIRETISHFFMENPIILGSSNSVQIDESLFGGKRKYNRGNHQVHMKSWVFGIIEEGTKRNVLWMVDERNATTLISIIKQHVITNATIKSDEWRAYSSLRDEDYNHLTVNHSVNFVSTEGVHTQLIEGLWSQVKSMLKTKCGTGSEQLPGYLDLYSFQSEAKYEQKDILDKFIEIIQVGNFY